MATSENIIFQEHTVKMNAILRKIQPIFCFFSTEVWKSISKKKQAFDSIAGNTVVPYRSLKKFYIYHKLLFIVIYNSTFIYKTIITMYKMDTFLLL